MCGSSPASQKRRNGRNARLKTPSCGRHDVRGRWRRSVDDPHPKPLRPVPLAQSRAFCYAQADRSYREGSSTCAVCRQHARNAETAATRASKAPCDAIMLRSSCTRASPRHGCVSFGLGSRRSRDSSPRFPRTSCSTSATIASGTPKARPTVAAQPASLGCGPKRPRNGTF